MLVLGLAFGFVLGKFDSSSVPSPTLTKVVIGFMAFWFLALCTRSAPLARILQFCTGWGIGAMIAVAYF